MSQSKEIICTYTAVWSDMSIETDCTYDPATGEVTPEMSNAQPEGCLEREYIILPDGDELNVCTTCHSYVTKKVMGDRADLSYGEIERCSDPDCNGEE
jgi:hypothetical protein